MAERERDINLILAVGRETGTGRLTIIEESGLTTLDPRVAALHEQAGWNSREVEVKLDTLNNILLEHADRNKQIQSLKVDVEGLEGDVLEDLNLHSWRPWIVLMESTVPGQQPDEATWV